MTEVLRGELKMPKCSGKEIRPGVFLIGEPTPRPDLGPNKFACLADVSGALCLVELSIRVLKNETDKEGEQDKEMLEGAGCDG